MAETEKQKKKRLKAERLEARRLQAEARGEDFEEQQEDEDEDGIVYTYVGAGTEPPVKINFMGKQVFIRGKATTVTNAEVLAKLKGHPCFVEGEVDQEDLHDQDEEATVKAEKQRKIDEAVNKAFQKKHMTE